jgi:ribosome biogenesis GTPase A
LKGIVSRVDLIVCVIDAFDYHIKGTKMEKLLKKWSKDENGRDIAFVMTKSDMLDNDEEIKE